jgi:hypothetical protein
LDSFHRVGGVRWEEREAGGDFPSKIPKYSSVSCGRRSRSPEVKYPEKIPKLLDSQITLIISFEPVGSGGTLGDIEMPKGIKTPPRKQLPKRLRIEIPTDREELIRAVQIRALRKGLDAREVAAEAIEEAFSSELKEIETEK